MKNKTLSRLLFGIISFSFVCSAGSITTYAEEPSVVASEEIVHHHSGSSAGGGCYNHANWDTRVVSGTITKACGSFFTEPWKDDSGNWYGSCGNGHTVAGYHAIHSPCSETTEQSYSYTESYIKDYSMDCNCTEGESLAKLGMSASTLEWALDVDLTAYVVSGANNLNSMSYKWNTNATTATINVTQNGVYYCDVSYKERNSATVRTTRLSYEVTNIDRVEPEVTPTWDDSLWERDKTITLTAVDKNDITDCVGLHDKAYRYYDETLHVWTEWTNDATYLVTENGKYKWECRDKLGNTATGDFEATHIDYTSPQLSVYVNRTSWESTKKMKVQGAYDDQSGLNSKTFRLYNGAENKWTDWSSTSSWILNANGTYIVEARDAIVERNGNTNVTSQTFEVTKIDAGIDENDIKVTYSPSTLTKESVVATVTATCPAGLHLTPYSFDYGKTWQASNTNVYDENTDTFVYVRSISGRISQAPLKIDWIDKQAPQIFRADVGETLLENLKITVKAKDNKKLADEAYSFDGGNTWQASNEATLDKKTSYYICVRDFVGNVARYTVTYDIDINEATNIVMDVGEQEEDLYLVTHLKGIKEQDVIRIREGIKTLGENNSPTEMRIIDGDINALTDGLGYPNEDITKDNGNKRLPDWVIPSAIAGLLLLSSLLLAGGMVNNLVDIKVVDGESEKIIAKTRLKKAKNKYYISIKDKWFNNHNKITIVFSKKLVDKYKDEEILLLGENVEKLSIRKFIVQEEVDVIKRR